MAMCVASPGAMFPEVNYVNFTLQTEKLRIQREAEDRLEQQTVRYEERITELHSVIAELRKKIDRHQINVIR